MVDFDPCPVCIEQGVCPRCAHAFTEAEWTFDGDETPCPNCGWNWRHNPDDAYPEQPECHCYLDEIMREAQV
jgi:hypothetical protein